MIDPVERISIVCKLLILAALLAATSGCSYWLEPGAYRLRAQSDEAPTAYRNLLNASEKLTIPIKLSNLGALPLHVASDRVEGKDPPVGLFMQAHLLTPSPYVADPDATMIVGLSGDRTLQDSANDHRLPFIDWHQRAVDKLADAGPPLLNLDADDVKTGFRLIGNEILVLAVFDVAWDKVETSPLVVDAPLEVELSFFYRNPDQTILRFERTIQYRVKAFFINGQRGNRAFAPVGDPEEGEFKPTTP